MEASGVYQLGAEISSSGAPKKESSTAGYLQQRKLFDWKTSPQVPVFDFSSSNPMINKVNTEGIDDSCSPNPLLSDHLQKNLDSAIIEQDKLPPGSDLNLKQLPAPPL
mmetsp:Transcript_24301/g.37554  ORF Transcript_24301/g.37554 Transcript_24301/m.37554 type:complete len:108 (-) Transcript_24301:1844-2167(-)